MAGPSLRLGDRQCRRRGVGQADGRLLRADADRHRDLFWALRGGGGNFGVVTSFDFVAQTVTSVHYGAIDYEPGDLRRLVTGWRDLMRSSDDNLTTTLTLMPPMMGRPASAKLGCCYADPDGAVAARALEPFRRLGPVVGDDIRSIPYSGVLIDAHDLPGGVRVETRNILLHVLEDGLVTAIEDLLTGGGVAVTLRSLGGAVSRVPADATAFAHRGAEAMLVAVVFLPANAAPDQVHAIGSRWGQLASYGSGAYVNFLGSATATDIAAAYPPATYQRLAAVKRTYDPQNAFRRNHNIRPAATQ